MPIPITHYPWDSYRQKSFFHFDFSNLDQIICVNVEDILIGVKAKELENKHVDKACEFKVDGTKVHFFCTE